jgi:hypothetical protein
MSTTELNAHTNLGDLSGLLTSWCVHLAAANLPFERAQERGPVRWASLIMLAGEIMEPRRHLEAVA